MKTNFKNALKLFVRICVVNFMCIMICLSVSVLCVAAFSNEIGYTAFRTVGEGEEAKSEKLYDYYFSSGEDTKKAEREAAGDTVTTTKITELTKAGNKTYIIISQLFCIIILIAFVYPNLWQIGRDDINLVKYKHKPEDKFKGLKIGLIASIPSFFGVLVLLIFALGAMPSFSVNIYRLLNAQFFTLIESIFDNAVKASQLGVPQFIALFLLTLLIPAVSCGSYILGYKNISLSEKFIYKNNKKSR